MLPKNRTFDEIVQNLKFAYRKSPVLTVDLFNDVLDLIKLKDGNQLVEGNITAEKVRSLLEQLTGNERLSASAIKDLAENIIVNDLSGDELTLQTFVQYVFNNIGETANTELLWENIIDRPTKLSEFYNDGDGTSKFITIGESEILVSSKIDIDTCVINGLELSKLNDTTIVLSEGQFIYNDYNGNSVIINRDDQQIILLDDLDSNEQIAYFALNSDNELVIQYNDFSFEQRRYLAVVGHTTYGDGLFSFVNNFRVNKTSVLHQLHDLIKVLGIMNLSGNQIVLSTNRRISKTEGVFFGSGLNSLDNFSPNQLISPNQNEFSFKYVYKDNSFSVITQDLNNSSYNSVGYTLNPATINKFVFSKFSMNINQQWLAELSENEYDSLEEAVSATNDFTSSPLVEKTSIFSFFIVSKTYLLNLLNGLNNGDAAIIDKAQFGTSSSSLTYDKIISALGYTPENITNKATDLSSPNNTTYPTTKAVQDAIDAIDTSGGISKFVADFGGGSSTTWIITHGLNTLDLIVEFYENSSGERFYTTYRAVGVNSIEITVSSPAATNAYKVVIYGK